MNVESKPPWRKLALAALGVAALLGLVYFSPLRGYLTHWREISQQLRGLGPWGPVVFTLGVAVLVALGFPRLLLCVIAGMTFGFWQGLLWAQLGTLLGNYVLFFAARYFLHDWAVKVLAHRGRSLHDLVRREGMAGVILARQVPVPGLLINLACGLLPLRQRHFLLGTIIGQVPEAIPATLFGAAGAHGELDKRSVLLIGLAVAAMVIAWFGLRWFTRRQARGTSARGTE